MTATTLPAEWKFKNLGQLGRVVRGSSPRPAGDPRYFKGTYIPWLTVASLTSIPESQVRVVRTASRLTEEGSKRSRTLQPETLIIANSGATLGVAKILGITCCANDGIAALVDQKSGSREFLCYYLNTQTTYLRDVVAPGNGQPNLNTNLIRGIDVSLPPEPEQRAIVGVLADADSLIEALGALITKKRAIKQGMMQELLTGRTRLPGSSGEWRAATFGDVVQIRRGSVLTHAQSTRGRVPVVAGGKTPAGFTDRPNRGGQTITISASGASAGYIAIYNVPIFASDCSTISRAKTYDLNFIYFSLVLRQEQIFRAQTGGAQPHIHARDVYPIGLQVPPSIEEQRAIGSLLQETDAEIATLERRMEATRAIKQGMMQELLTGRTRLSLDREITS